MQFTYAMSVHIYEFILIEIQFSNNNLDIGHAKSVVDFYSFIMNIKNHMENNFPHILDITAVHLYTLYDPKCMCITFML